MDAVDMKLLQSFPSSFINQNGEFIAHEKANESFSLISCKDEEEVKCKVLEWLSRGAYKKAPFSQNKKNKEFNAFMLKGINEFLGTDFTVKDIRIIYCELGNGVNRKLTKDFIDSSYDMKLLGGK